MLKTKNISGKRTRETTSTMTALSLAVSFHQSCRQLGTVTSTPAFVSGGGGEGDVRRGSALPSPGPSSLPT